MAKSASSETQQQAMRVAKATQKPGQTKEQTKLIATGIEKGIAEYKKQQKVKARERDKHRKQQLKQKHHVSDELELEHDELPTPQFTAVAKILLLLLIGSWCAIGYLLTQG
ncbi:DUF2956 domain-containing protein [Shewanella intestini]|uniref:DUF2956 family protein n=1 Tax=Shewanella intestini TaxID=2017544 RepID=A0ABS5I5R9_9GAMM|nr:MULTISPECIES: DUF2956 domain-containing protein [Shewanella]MBR9728725.1 DUF2956 family protein [Shewanella intestini]MRG36801.1 DUF2956 family protein [Shewanella sp. XMDDZSB0408]